MAAVKTKEDYDVFSTAFAKILAEINELIERGRIEVEGVELMFELFLVADYKVYNTPRSQILPLHVGY